jgi:hypothetical protein
MDSNEIPEQTEAKDGAVDLNEISSLTSGDLNEISNLIGIRNYISTMINNYAISRDTVANLNKMVIVLDRRIVDKLLSNEFKEYVGFQDAEKLLSEARKISDIKSGLKLK